MTFLRVPEDRRRVPVESDGFPDSFLSFGVPLLYQSLCSAPHRQTWFGAEAFE